VKAAEPVRRLLRSPRESTCNARIVVRAAGGPGQALAPAAVETARAGRIAVDAPGR
jgi:hypothetical protein